MTVQEAADTTCDTGTVKPLSDQIIERLLQQNPGTLVKVTDSRLVYQARVNMILQACARDSLMAALSAGGRQMEVISAYRTVAQQVMLYRQYRQGRCGITLASQPGDSNHEDGAALDIGDTDYWRPFLTGRGWNWQGSNDPAHYSYRGAGFDSGVGARGLLAFQTLWNEHNPGDLLAEDGCYGPATEAALLASPAEGWTMQPIGIEINGVDQSTAVAAGLQSGNSWLDASDWCRFADYPVPTYSNATDTLFLSTQKVHCQVRVSGERCANYSVTEYPVPLPGQDLSLPTWVCTEHLMLFQSPQPELPLDEEEVA